MYRPIAKRFCYFDDEFLKKKRRKYDLDCFLLPGFLRYWILELSLTMPLLVLWRYWRHWIQIWSPISGCENTAIHLFIYLHQCSLHSRLSWWAKVGVWRSTAAVGGSHSWTTKGLTDLKHWNVKILKHEKSGKLLLSIQVDL